MIIGNAYWKESNQKYNRNIFKVENFSALTWKFSISFCFCDKCER